MKYSRLLFDADGTLFDFDRAEQLALARTFQQAGHTFLDEHSQAYARINSELWVELEAGRVNTDRLSTLRFERLFDFMAITDDAERFSRDYLLNLGDRPDLIDGTEELLARLHGQAEMMLITNGQQDVQRSRLAKSTIERYFSDIVISGEVGAAKPDSRIFDEAFRRLGRPNKSEVLIIGDSLSSDIKGGENYGIDTCWFNPNAETNDSGIRATYEIRSLPDLLSVVG